MKNITAKIFGNIPKIPPPVRVYLQTYTAGKSKHFASMTIYADPQEVQAVIESALNTAFGTPADTRRS